MEDLRAYRDSGVIVDTNLFLLNVIGAFDLRLVGTGRLDAYTKVDFLRLNRLLSPVRNLVTTPAILTEVSNLAGLIIRSEDKPRFFEKFAAVISGLAENYEQSALIAATTLFPRFGLTDAGIASLARSGLLVLTDDFRLSGFLRKAGLRAMNFNHLRE